MQADLMRQLAAALIQGAEAIESSQENVLEGQER